MGRQELVRLDVGTVIFIDSEIIFFISLGEISVFLSLINLSFSWASM